jgi:flagellar biosynthesis GTPase FlhF
VDVSLRRTQRGVDKDKEELYPISNEPTAPIRQTRAKTGASQKAATAAPELAGGVSDEPTPVIPPQAHKHGRKPTDKVENAPPAKKTKDDKVSVTEPAAKTTATKKADALPRAPLPDHQGRNVHPAGQTVRRHTAAEVAAEQEAKRKAIEDKIQELERAKQLLAEMNVAEDLEMDDGNPQRLSAAAWKRTCDELDYDSDGGEAFNFDDVDVMPDSDLEEPAPKAKAVSMLPVK